MAIVSVTHRISTTTSADMIYVMKQGEMVECGTYNELLLQPNSLFSELAKTKQPDRKQSIRFGSNLCGTNNSLTASAIEKLTRELDNRSIHGLGREAALNQLQCLTQQLHSGHYYQAAVRTCQKPI
ncbi:hypothetical protein THRCLA_22912 [Thraustotheca clavata]|uniref:ATP-binding Cassette (ABC) Superfamily n=1 Tax=Thraustotheca clavata TaxID=74557 RepID=A0A1V9YPA8_9STRA|nr:hypothetical protein THRCLA_22912 [Thraustotheca clavata]